MKLKNIIIALAIGFITLSNNVWCYADETPSKAINILTEEEYQNKNSLMEQERLRIEQETLEEIKNNPVTLSETEVNPMGLPDIDPVTNPASDNWLTREVAKQVGKSNISNLTQEDFNKVRYIEANSSNIKEIPKEIANLYYLNSLYLVNNEISYIPPEIGNLINLQFLNLGDNKIEIIPSEIGNLTNIGVLGIAQNKIKYLPPELFNLTTVHLLALFYNQITTIPDEINKMVNLQSLYIDNNPISSFPDDLHGLSKLSSLSLDRTKLKDFPIAITNIPKLAFLGLSYNEISVIPPEIKNLCNLNYLQLSNNKINFLPIELKDLVNLKRLTLNNQEVTLPNKYINPNREFCIENPLSVFSISIIPTNISNNGIYNSNDNTIKWLASDTNRDETFEFSQSFTIGTAKSKFSGTVTVPTIIEEKPLSLELSNTSVSQSIYMHGTLSIPISLKGTGNYYALDTQIEYNSELLEFKGYSVKNGLKAYYSSNENNILRYILASQGKDNPINSSVSDIVYLNFTSKKAGITDIKIKSGKIANLDKEVDINDLGSIYITIEKQTEVKDINRDGKFTLIDLAIDGYYYGMNVNETDNTKYEADIISDGKIDDTDLKEIVKHILNNPDYSK